MRQGFSSVGDIVELASRIVALASTPRAKELGFFIHWSSTASRVH